MLLNSWLSALPTLARTRNSLVNRTDVLTHDGVARFLDKIEKPLSQDPDSHFEYDNSGYATLIADSKRYSAGYFETPTLHALKRRVENLKSPISESKSVLSAFVGRDPLFDVGTLQASAPPNTLFQVASQFNCLEAASAAISPVADYVYDPTQGPRASVSAFPGVLLRHYQAPGKTGRFVQGSRNAEGAIRQIDLLADAISQHAARVQCGYLRSSDIVDKERLVRELEENFELIRVGLHDRIEVALGYNWGGFVPSPAPKISQVLTSTVALGGYSLFAQNYDPICRPLLRAAYFGTLLSAASLKCQNVVLTLIGGGVFGNSHKLIWEAILWSLEQMDSLPAPSLNVIVNVWGQIAPEAANQVKSEISRRQGIIASAERGKLVVNWP